MREVCLIKVQCVLYLTVFPLATPLSQSIKIWFITSVLVPRGSKIICKSQQMHRIVSKNYGWLSQKFNIYENTLNSRVGFAFWILYIRSIQILAYRKCSFLPVIKLDSILVTWTESRSILVRITIWRVVCFVRDASFSLLLTRLGRESTLVAKHIQIELDWHMWTRVIQCWDLNV